MTRDRWEPDGKLRWVILLVVTVSVVAGAGVYAAQAFQRFQAASLATSSAAIAAAGSSLPDQPFVLFRNTASGQGYGQAATVLLSAPGAERAVGGAACDRVYGTRREVMCLRTNRGLVTSYEAALYDRNWQEVRSWALRGIPSRTRLDGTGSAAATTVFVTGHSYAGTGFSTETVISPVEGGPGTGSLEDFALWVNGAQVSPSDRNIWGVTFMPGQSDSFYATAASNGRTWLVEGSVSARKLTAVHDAAECPSVSPDGKSIAYKKNMAGSVNPHWNIAVLDIATGTETLLAETRNVDDQVEWLDGHTVLYGLGREDSAGDSDIWRLDVAGASRPELFIEHAWSPSVVR
jgi:hypothetical protein